MNSSMLIEHPQVMWEPKEIPPSRTKFVKLIQEKYKQQFRNYWDLHKWSIENLEAFWEEIWKFSGIISSQTYTQVIDTTIKMYENPTWFDGARLNVAENMLKYRDDYTALIIAGETRQPKRVSYSQVFEQSKRYAAAFRKIGLKKDDVVVCYMSNREEAVYAMLGAVSVGAIWTGALPLMGSQAVLNRFEQVSPRILITVDRFQHNEEEKEMLHKVKQIAAELSTLEMVIVVPSTEQSKMKDISGIRNSCFLDEFLEYGLDEEGNVPEIEFEQLSFSHPVYISYTSGTTGKPKPIVHGAGCLLSMQRDFYLHNEGTRDLVTLSMSPVGWASWNIITAHLSNGVTLVVYEGVPFFLSPTYLWDMVDEFKLTVLFLTPSVLDELEKKGYVPTQNHSLESLTTMFCAGSVVKPQNYDFVYQKIKKGIKFSSGYGSTELMGSCMIFDSTLPIHRGELPCPSLGVHLQCLNEKGESVVGEMGELVISSPTPSLPLCLLGDTDGKRYRETYFSKFKEKFELGDIAMINPVTNGIIIYGRSDETLKPRGCRFGSSEIYNIVNVFEEVHDSLCVSQYSPNRNERALLFIKMKEGYLFDQSLVTRVRKAIEDGLSARHVPDLILEVTDIPHNLNGKKMEITVKKLINNMPYNDDTVTNKESLEYFRTVPPYED